MYKIQLVDSQQWQPGQRLTFQLETLLENIGDVPLHVSEFIFRMELQVQNPAGDISAFDMLRVFDRIDLIPNNSCEASRVDGRAAALLDYALTGRFPAVQTPNATTPPGTIDWTATVRLPFHACLNGAKGDKYADLISPVERFQKGNIHITTSPQQIYANSQATVDGGIVEVLVGTEPMPDGFHVGAIPVYDLDERPAGPSFQWTNKGRLMFLGLSPEGGNSSEYATIDVPEACWVSALTRRQLIDAWQAYQALGGLNEIVGGETNDGPFLPILWTRPCGAKFWTSPDFGRGNKYVNVPGNSAEFHRVLTAQLMMPGTFLEQLSRRVGLRAAMPRIKTALASDRLRSSMVMNYLPREIPFWAIDRAGRVLRRRKDR